MKLPIEKWADEARLPSEARAALDEATICYRSGAYRAALLFSYLCWGLTLRRRILVATCPPGLPEAKWEAIQRAMQDEDRWDAEVFDATQRNQPSPVFNVTDDLRTQVRYWKDRRNDCAHSKSNQITSANVETMWGFLRSNLARFAVGGSVEDLLTRVRDHFDSNLNPPNANCDYLANAIAAAVPAQDRQNFFKQVTELFTTRLGKHTRIRIGPVVRFYESVLRCAGDDVLHSAQRYLMSNETVLVMVLLAHPKHVSLLDGHPTAIRKLWRSQLPKLKPNSLRVVASLLRMGLIPESEKAELIARVVSELNVGPPQAEDLSALQDSGYAEKVREVAFVEYKVDRFGWGNQNATVVRWYIERHKIDDEIAKALCAVFDSSAYPFEACNELRELFSSNPTKHAEFESACKSIGREVPTALVEAPATEDGEKSEN